MKKKSRNRTEGKKGHIAFYIGSLHKGGAERVFVNLAAYFAGKGYRVTMVTQYRMADEYTLPRGVERVLSDIEPGETGGRLGNFGKRYRKLRRIFRSLGADAVLSTIGKNNFMAIAANLGLGSRVVVSVVAEPSLEYPGRLMRFLARSLFYLADGVVLQTKQAGQFFPAGIQKKSIILKNSLHPDFLRPRYTGVRAQDIVAVGRLDENKNQRMAIRAYCRIADAFPQSRLLLYGEGECRQALEALVEERGLQGRVLLPGAVTDVADRIEKAYAFVLTSFTEGMPNTLLEAMALGLPCISTDCPCGGPKELIQDGVNGYLVGVDDDEALAERLSALLADPVLADRMGTQAALLQEDYRPEQVNAAWEAWLMPGGSI